VTLAGWAPARQLTDVEKAIQKISEARSALEDATIVVEEVADIGDRIRSWLDRERTKLPGLTHAEVQLIERLISDLEAS